MWEAQDVDPDIWQTWPIPEHGVNTRHSDGRPFRLSEFGTGWVEGFEAGMNWRRVCGLCSVTLGGRGCSHVWQGDGEVVMSLESWYDLQDWAALGRAADAAREDSE